MATGKELRRVLARALTAKMQANPDLDTQPKLAQRSGVAQSYISAILNAKHSASVDRLQALAKAFGCQPWELLIDDEAIRREAVERVLGPPSKRPKQHPDNNH